jgi:hypothetical protein
MVLFATHIQLNTCLNNAMFHWLKVKIIYIFRLCTKRKLIKTYRNDNIHTLSLCVNCLKLLKCVIQMDKKARYQHQLKSDSEGLYCPTD